MKPCIKLASPDGSMRLVTEGVAYTLAPGERIAGVDRTCSGAPLDQRPVTSHVRAKRELLTELNAELGSGAGDWVKTFAGPIAKLLNKESCMTCEVRRIILNAYAPLRAQHGRLEAVRRMQRLWKQAANGEHQAVLKEIKELLNA
jgi:hypothetical protein